MKKSALFLFALGFFLSVLCFGAAVVLAGDTKPSKDYYIYCLDSTDTVLERMSFVPSDESRETLLPELMQRLNSRDDTMTFHRLLPDNIEISSYEIFNDILQVVFDETYSEVASGRELLIRAGVVKTFLQVPGIMAVRFVIGNSPLKNSRGEEVGEMTSNTFVEFGLSDRDAYRYDTFTLYFADDTGKKLLPESRTIYYRRSIPKGRVALEQLINGPIASGNYPTVPPDTLLISIQCSDNVCYVDFNSIFLEEALPNVEDEVIIQSVAATVLDATGMDKVQITVNGTEDVKLKEETSLYRFITKDAKYFPSEEEEEEKEEDVE